jgi:hypothetical protein
MKLFIPEIKDTLILQCDWSFILHAESRNSGLGMFFNHWLHFDSSMRPNYENWVSMDELSPMRKQDWNFSEPWPTRKIKTFFRDGETDEEWNKRLDEFTSKNPEYVKWHNDYRIFKQEVKKVIKPHIQVTIPKGCELIVDRVYIRKGSSDFSSLTFLVKGLGELDLSQWPLNSLAIVRGVKHKTSTFRFWAKLDDVNNIEFNLK